MRAERTRPAAPPPLPPPRLTPEIDLLLSAVALSRGVAPEALLAPTRSTPHVAEARQILMYLAHVGLGLSLAQAAGIVGRDRTTAAHACRVVEERREDAAFDTTLSTLEAGLKSLIAPARPLSVRLRGENVA